MGFALFFGGLAQFCAGMWELWRNNMFAGVAFTSYGAFWLSWGIFNILALVSMRFSTGAPAVAICGGDEINCVHIYTFCLLMQFL